MAQDRDTAAKHAEALLKISDQIATVIADWQGSVRNNDAISYSQFAVRIAAFQEFAPELARHRQELRTAGRARMGG